MSTYSDYFSDTAALYASFGPSYPAEQFGWLAQHTPRHLRAWDCGTGSG
jgi:hypothetical protein